MVKQAEFTHGKVAAKLNKFLTDNLKYDFYKSQSNYHVTNNKPFTMYDKPIGPKIK